MIPLPWHDDRVADRLDDVAGGLDAGLAPADVLRYAGGPPDAQLHQGLVPALVPALRLGTTETAALEAAEASGRLPTAMRRIAGGRRRRAMLVRELAGQLTYPFVLLVMAALVFGVPVLLRGGAAWGELAPLVILMAVGVLAGLAIWRISGDPRWSPRSLPWVGRLVQDVAEVPYLDALAALYGSGVPLVRAHAQALRGVPIAHVRARLFAAESRLEGGEPFVAALGSSQALSDETMHMLTLGEASGGLEEALERASERRRDALTRRARRLTRIVGTFVYLAVAAYVAVRVIGFYSGLYAGLDRFR